jgi:hypothetical protein
MTNWKNCLKCVKYPNALKAVILRARQLLHPIRLGKMIQNIDSYYSAEVHNPVIWKTAFKQLRKVNSKYDGFIQSFFEVSMQIGRAHV